MSDDYEVWYEKWHDELGVSEMLERIISAIDVGIRYGQIDGGHHKTWVIDQMIRALTGSSYDEIIKEANDGEDGPETYDWDVGIPP